MWKKLLTFALIANIVLTAGCVTAADKKAPSAEEADTYEMLNLFGEIMERTKASYVEEVSDQKLIESAINGMLLNEAVDKMRGKSGTKIKLTIRRGTEKPFDVTLKREEIKIQSVKSEIKAKDVAYIRISSFSEEVDKNVKDALAQMQKKTKNGIGGLVIDVRNNPGGLLDQAVAVSDLFLDKGEIVSTRSRNEEDTIKYNATKGDVADHKRAIIMGEKSFGKGSVQSVIPFAKYGAIRLTTARYYTPSGRSIQAKGIEPDIEVKPAKVELLNFDGLTISEAELKNALKNDNVEAGGKDQKADDKDKNGDNDEDLQKDYQLLRAVDTIKALSIYAADKK